MLAFALAFSLFSCDDLSDSDIVEELHKARTTQITFYDQNPIENPNANSVGVRYEFEYTFNINSDYPKDLKAGGIPEEWKYIDFQNPSAQPPVNVSVVDGKIQTVYVTQRELCFYVSSWHVHTYSAAWASDDTNHWHSSTCGHDITSDKAEHDWKTEVITPVTQEDDGEEKHTCNICGKTKTVIIPALGHAHTFDETTWTSDDTNHWRASTCGHNVTKDQAAHTASDWENDDEKHWQECTVCNEKFNEAAHTWSWNSGKCVCSDCAIEKEFLASEVAECLAAHSGETVTLKVKATSSDDLTAIKTALTTYKDTVTGVNLELTDGITIIDNSAFKNCTSLKSVTIPDKVTTIEGSAFYGCSSLTSVEIPSTSELTSIGGYAFGGCTSLTSVTIPKGVESIENYAFRDCSSLESVTIPDSVTSIGSSAFYGCSSLMSVEISSTSRLTSIGTFAFYKCTSLTSVTIPDKVTSIGESVFKNCSALESVTVEATTPPALGTGVFTSNKSGRKIYVPAASVATYKAADGWSAYAADIEAKIP